MCATGPLYSRDQEKQIIEAFNKSLRPIGKTEAKRLKEAFMRAVAKPEDPAPVTEGEDS